MDYTDLYNFITANGIIVPSDDAILDGVREKFQEIFGTDLDVSAETPVGRLIEAFTVLIKSSLGVTAQSANQVNLDYCTGTYLDSIGRLFLLERKVGTKTRIRVRCSFSGPTASAAPMGATIMNPATGDVFQLDEAITGTLSNGGYYGEGTATAIEDGPIEADPGTVTVIQTSAFGWLGVTNTALISIGTNLETDAAFRERLKLSRSIGIGFRQALESRLLRLDGVYSVCVLENNNTEEAVVKDVIIPGHSIFVCVYTGASYPGDDTNQAIAEAIATTKPAGTGMVKAGEEVETFGGATSHTVTISNGIYSTDVTYFTPAMLRLKVKVLLKAALYSGTDLENDIVNAIISYVSDTGIGSSIYITMMAKYILTEVSGVDISNIELYTVDESGNKIQDISDSISSAGYQKFFTEKSDIEIVEV